MDSDPHIQESLGKDIAMMTGLLHNLSLQIHVKEMHMSWGNDSWNDQVMQSFYLKVVVLK